MDEGTLFLKIAPDKEKPTILHRLQSILKKYPGRSSVALFYERGSRLQAAVVSITPMVPMPATSPASRMICGCPGASRAAAIDKS